jgi:hypothetical protein
LKHVSSFQLPSKGVVSSDEDLLDNQIRPDVTTSVTIVPQPNKNLTSREDNWDPWEANVASQQMVVYADPEDKGKCKAIQEPKHSSRLQQKYTTNTSSSKGTTSSKPVLGTASLLDNFPFVNFSDAEVISLFENI